MRKIFETRCDPYLTLLDWRNTLSESINASPGLRILGRVEPKPSCQHQYSSPSLRYLTTSSKLKDQKAKVLAIVLFKFQPFLTFLTQACLQA